ncbi:DUF4173 domain-containing protein [Clostridium sp. AL.422]|uniref:DUF4153 domain-containing protein n=1 Tax=Clostridium TaxID=1485 RepID=UPI00293DD60E|nr:MULTISPECIES: DUF4173 domain-containing protein [unclassified Clostridium]MDV4152654.1 DUF4173 domain-containing protein [Clostridium sp. AL.422]
MVNVVSLVLMKAEKILLLKRTKNRLPIIAMNDNETPEKCIERWTKDNIEIGTSKLIKIEKNFKIDNYNISLIFIDTTNTEVNIFNEELVFEDCKYTSNINKVEEELLINVVKKCNLINYRSLAIESLSKTYNINNKPSLRNPFMELEKGRMNNKKALNLIVLSLLVGALFSIFVFNYLGVSVPIIIGLMVILFINIVGIRNKSFLGFFFVAASIILSLTYGIFTNEVFRFLNLIVIPISLFSGFLLLTYNNIQFKLVNFIVAFFELIVGQSIENTSKLSVELKERFGNVDREKKNGYSKHILKGILISIPLVIVLLMLLSGADEVFSYYLSNIWEYINIENIFDFVIRVIIAMAVMFLVYGLNYTLSSTKVKKVNNKGFNRTFNATTIVTILVSIILIYLVFTKIQVSYLYLNKELPADVTFADYARSGFFQLVFLVVLDLIMIISIKLKTIVNSSRTNNVLNIVYSIITVLTINMGVAAIYKMNLYIGEFGYTRLRILVQAFTVFLCISLVFLLLFIWRENNLFKPIAIVAMAIYLALNYGNIDNFIAKENIKLINQREEIDLWYLSKLSLDARDAIEEGRKSGLVSMEYYNLWLRKIVTTDHWYEYNYYNNEISK